MSSYLNTLAIVINSRYVRESDLVVTLLTQSLGKITVTAKGAKNIKSSRLGSLQLGNIIKAHLFKKGDYLWLTESTTISQFLHSEKTLTQINLLFYFLEILNLFIADNQQIDSAFNISQKIIEAITQNQFAQFINNEIKFIDILGFGLPLEITDKFQQKDYTGCQKLIRQHLESILDRPLQSSKMFQ